MMNSNDRALFLIAILVAAIGTTMVLVWVANGGNKISGCEKIGGVLVQAGDNRNGDVCIDQSVVLHP